METDQELQAAQEQQLIETARDAVNQSAWIVGRCAASWIRRYARGRTDSDFGDLIGLSGDQVYARRRVIETFDDVASRYENLRWSHFYVALTWDDAPECLAWADENEATVAEMKAWRRMQHGEDLTQPGDEPEPDESPERSGNSPADSEAVEHAEPQRTQAAAGPAAVLEEPPAPSKAARERGPDAASDNGDGAARDRFVINRMLSKLRHALNALDDPEAGITDMLALMWQVDQENTFRALRRFAQVNGIK